MKKNRHETCWDYSTLKELTKSINEFALRYRISPEEVSIDVGSDYDGSAYLELNCETEETEIEKQIRVNQEETYKAERLRQFEQLKKEFEGE